MEVAVAKIVHPTGDIYYVTPNEAVEYRVKTLFTKEPDTIAWIAEMDPGDVFVDVGANVGMYTIWAAKTTGARVFAFEPESQNFALLNQNIYINKCDTVAYPIGLYDECRYGPLYLSQFIGGGSCHTFGVKENFKGELMTPKFSQGAVAATLDSLVGDIVPQPDYIKIDVDGLEHAVVDGAEGAIAGARSLLIEINTNMLSHRALLDRMACWGFTWNEGEAEKARRTEGAFKGVGNVIFRRR